MPKRYNKETVKTTVRVPRTVPVQQVPATVGTTLNVPTELWRRLRNHSTDVRTSQQAIWLAAMTQYLDRQAKGVA
jgi:hypothetical protein